MVIFFPQRRGSRQVLATVLEVDPPDLPPGVRLALDDKVNGVDTAYASHTEVRLVHDAT